MMKKTVKGDKPATVTLRHLSNALSEAHAMPKKQANAVLVRGDVPQGLSLRE